MESTLCLTRAAKSGIWLRPGRHPSCTASADHPIDVQQLFHAAVEYAEHANRHKPTAADALLAQDDALEAKRLKVESKKRRAGESEFSLRAGNWNARGVYRTAICSLNR